MFRTTVFVMFMFMSQVQQAPLAQQQTRLILEGCLVLQNLRRDSGLLVVREARRRLVVGLALLGLRLVGASLDRHKPRQVAAVLVQELLVGQSLQVPSVPLVSSLTPTIRITHTDLANAETEAPAPVTTGTASPQYSVYDEKDGLSIIHYQSITCMPAYRGSSFEVNIFLLSFWFAFELVRRNYAHKITNKGARLPADLDRQLLGSQLKILVCSANPLQPILQILEQVLCSATLHSAPRPPHHLQQTQHLVPSDSRRPIQARRELGVCLVRQHLDNLSKPSSNRPPVLEPLASHSNSSNNNNNLLEVACSVAEVHLETHKTGVLVHLVSQIHCSDSSCVLKFLP